MPLLQEVMPEHARGRKAPSTLYRVPQQQVTSSTLCSQRGPGDKEDSENLNHHRLIEERTTFIQEGREAMSVVVWGND